MDARTSGHLPAIYSSLRQPGSSVRASISRNEGPLVRSGRKLATVLINHAVWHTLLALFVAIACWVTASAILEEADPLFAVTRIALAVFLSVVLSAFWYSVNRTLVAILLRRPRVIYFVISAALGEFLLLLPLKRDRAGAVFVTEAVLALFTAGAYISLTFADSIPAGVHARIHICTPARM